MRINGRLTGLGVQQFRVMDERPVWLLDVDGVINGQRAGWHAAPARASITDHWGYTWELAWSWPLISAIRGIHREGLAEVVWCTTWCPSADLLEAKWSLPELRRAWTDDLHGYARTEAKYAAARKVIADGRRLLWTDDDAFPATGARVEEFLGRRSLLIKPNQGRGLRPEHLDLIHEFLAGGDGPDEVVFASARKARAGR